MTEVSENTKRACAWYNYRWPEELASGILWFNGEKIRIEDFTSWAAYFR